MQHNSDDAQPRLRYIGMDCGICIPENLQLKPLKAQSKDAMHHGFNGEILVGMIIIGKFAYVLTPSG